MLICFVLFITIKDTFHHQHNFITDVNLLYYYYGNTFQPNTYGHHQINQIIKM